MSDTACDPLPDAAPPSAPDPEALIRSDNPWDWLLASFLGLGEGEVEPDPPAPPKRVTATRLTHGAHGRP